MMSKELPPHERYEKAVSDLLRLSGITARHPDYKFFRALLTGVFDAAERRNQNMRQLGERLLQLTAGETITPSAVTSIRNMGEALSNFYVSPDMNAVRGIAAAMRLSKLHLARQKSNNNLKKPVPRVTDAQIRKAIRLNSTRAEQAEYLDLTERQLQRRLQKLRKG